MGPCAFIAIRARGERVPCTWLEHIFIAVESETIVMFSHGALCSRSPSPGENTIVVLSVEFWVSRVGQHGIVGLEDGNSCFAALNPDVAIV